MKRGPNQHIVKNKQPDGGWAVKSAGNPNPIMTARTQKEANSFGQTIARILKSDTKVHGRNGKIRAGNSYGNDPFPPRDKK